MTKQPEITNITSEYASRSTLNTNFDNIRKKFDNTLSLDGSTPNSMGAALDMNSNDVINARSIYTNNLTVGGVKQTGTHFLEADVFSTETVLSLLGDSTYSYNQGSDKVTVAEGTLLVTRKEGFSYRVASPSAVDYHLITAGGTKLYAQELFSSGVFSPFQFGAIGNGVIDDTESVQKAADAARQVNSTSEKVYGTLWLGGHTFYITSKLTFKLINVRGGGSTFYVLGNFNAVELIGSKCTFENFQVWYETPSSDPSREAVTLCVSEPNLQFSKNTILNVITRNAYRGFVAKPTGGSCWGNTWINCRSDNSYDWQWHLDFRNGTTTNSFVSCHAKGSLSHGSPKGFFLTNCKEVSFTNLAIDQTTGGPGLFIENCQQVNIDRVAFESCFVTENQGSLATISGGVVDIGFISAAACLFDVGVGNKGYILKVFSSTKTLRISDITEIVPRAGSSGTIFKVRTNNKTRVFSEDVDLNDVDTLGSPELFNYNTAQGFVDNYSQLPVAGKTRRLIKNRLPTQGEPLFWVDNGTEWLASAPLTKVVTSSELLSASNTVNTGVQKRDNYVVYNSTDNVFVISSGSSANDPWYSYHGLKVYTPS